MPAKKERTIVNCKYLETEELRKFKVSDLGLPDKAAMVLYRIEAFTVGDVLDRWNELADLPGCGTTKLKHIKAAVFAQICEMGLLRDSELITIS